MQHTMSTYLEQSVNTFLEQQKALRDQMQNAMTANPMELMRKIAEQNLSMWKSFSQTPGKDDKDKKDN